MRLKLLLLLCLSLAATARAQSGFRIYLGKEKTSEGGSVEKLTVISSNLQFNFRAPRGWSHQADEAGRKIIFTYQSGRSALTVQFTTNSPDTLPAMDILRARVLQAHPGASIVQSAGCPTNYRPGEFFDLMRVPAPGLVQKVRHAFVPQPAGQVELILSAPDDEFGDLQIVLMDMVQSFQVTPIKPKQP